MDACDDSNGPPAPGPATTVASTHQPTESVAAELALPPEATRKSDTLVVSRCAATR